MSQLHTTFIPEGLGVVGLLGTLGFMFLLEALGGESKASGWMAATVAVIAATTALAVAIVALAAHRARRHRRWLGLILPCGLAGLLMLIIWGVVYPSHQSAREEIRLISEWLGFSHALIRYAEDHEGQLPRALADLVDGGYIRREPTGRWFVPRERENYTCELRDPAWFDVAWGISASELDDRGYLSTRGRFVVEPAPSVAHRRGFKSVCQGISATVGGTLRERIQRGHAPE